jgi:dUTP pyrophosphatase
MIEKNINVKKLNDLAKLPTRGSDYAAGYDLYAATSYNIEIQPHTTVKIGTGLSFELPQGTFAAIFPRSGIATKRGLRPANCVGVCDSDYRGEYIVAVHNDTDVEQTIQPGDRIAQMVLMPYISMIFEEVNNLTETERGAGGFGSTGA